MPSVTRSAAQKAKEDRKRALSAKKGGGISKSQSNINVRRSSRGLASKNQDSLTQSPSLRKSERLNKNIENSSLQTTPQSEKKKMSSPPEKHEEDNKQNCSGSANNLGGNEPMGLEMRSSSVVEMETEEELSVGSVEQAIKKRLDGRAYRKLLAKQVKMASSPGTPPDAMPISINSLEMIGECFTPERNCVSATSYDNSATLPSARAGTNVILDAPVEKQNEKPAEICPMCGKLKSDRSDSASQSTISSCNGECDPSIVSSCQEKTCIISNREEPSEHKYGVNEQHILAKIQDDHNVCEKCELGGMLLCCNAKECRRSYHPSCLNPPLTVVPLGIWYCSQCTLKKIKFGVHSVSPGIENICDVKDTKNGGKNYLVKFKGLAYAHTCWVQEGRLLGRLLEEAPEILDEFKKKLKQNKQAIDFNYDWLIPQRLVAKRSALSSEEIKRLVEKNSITYPCEWLVKWKGLGYENATWELETAAFLTSGQAMKLKSDFERRIKEAKEFSSGQRAEMLLNVRKGPRPTVTELPMIGNDSECLAFVNTILGRWYKCQNSVVIDAKEHIMKTASFILSVKRCVSLPVLIISSSHQIVDWEAEFLRLDPSLNVVAYVGDKNVRSNIQMLEFFEAGGSFMIEVLLSTPRAIIEDLDAFKVMDSWGVVVVDGTCGFEVWEHLEHMRNITSDFKLLLTGAQVKDDVSECISILSFLDTVNDMDSIQNATASNLPLLKKKIDQVVAFECKTLASKFLEHWVPIPFSDVQLEQYCHTLVTNFISLRTYLKSDQMGVISDVLQSVRKCCDHPYLLSPGLQASLSKNVQDAEVLQIGINACGKLRFLDKILSEMKNRGRRALILFQSIIGSDKISNGDILDDFLRQRFGGETYERIDVGLARGKKDAALNAFNDVTGARFVLLLENRACRSSIKLSSIDALIIFGSEWNPLIDLRTLMKIQIGSGSEQIKVFRLYTPFTVEEKALLMLNQDNTNLDFGIQTINSPNTQALLTWGASSLFKNLDEFHLLNESTASSGSYSCGVDLDDVVMEVLNEVLGDNVTSKSTANPLLTKVRYNGTTYLHDGSLVGAAEFELKDSEVSSNFWCKLLEGRSPCWKYFSESLLKTRKRAIPCDKIDEQEVGEEKAKKRQKVVNNVEPFTLKTWIDRQRQKAIAREINVDLSPSESLLIENHMGSAGPNKGKAIATSSKNRVEGMRGSVAMTSASSASEAADVSAVDSEGSKKLRNGQKSLHILLKPEIFRICHILQLPENLKNKAETLLEYVMLNHHVTSEPKAILHAFLLSLCWRAASLTSFNVNHKESLFLARKFLGFACQEHETEFVYLKICEITKKYSKDVCVPDTACFPEKQSLPESDRTLENDFGGVSVGREGSAVGMGGSNCDSVLSGKGEGLGQEVDGENSVTCESILRGKGEGLGQEVDGENSVTCNSVHSGKGEGLGQEVDGEHSVTSVELSGSEKVREACGRVEQICHVRNQQILDSEHNEICRFNKLREELVKNMENKYGSEDWFPRKLNKLTLHMDKCYRILTYNQKERRLAENKIKAQWLLEARAGTLSDLFGEVPLPELPFNVEDIRISAEKSIASVGLSKTTPISCDSSPSLEVDREPNQLIAGKDITCEPNQPGLSKEDACVENNVHLSSSGDKDCQVPLVEHIISLAGDGDSDPINTTPCVSSNSGSARTNDPDILQTNETSCSRQDEIVVQQSLSRPTTQFLHENYSSRPREQLVTPAAEPTRNMVITEHATRPQQRNGVTGAQRPQFVPPDPLQIEMEKILRQKEVSNTMTEDEKKRLNLEREKEIEEINKKYENLLQDAEVKFQQMQSSLDSNYRRVCLNRILAEAYKYRSSSRKVTSLATHIGITHSSRQISANDTERRAVLPHLQTQIPSATSSQTALDPLSHHGPSFDSWLASVDHTVGDTSAAPGLQDDRLSSGYR